MTASTNEFSVKTPAGMVTGPIQCWITAILNVMSPDIRARVFEQVTQMQADQFVIINPDGTRTVVLRAEKGVLKATGSNLGS